MKKVHLAGMLFAIAAVVCSVPAAADIVNGSFDVTFDDTGAPTLNGYSSNNGYGHTIYSYPNAPAQFEQYGPLYNEWYYLGPYQGSPNMANIELVFNLLDVSDSGTDGQGAIILNWTTPGWTNPASPPMSENYIERQLISTTVGLDQTFNFAIPNYSPEWLSIDVAGTSVWFNGVLDAQTTSTPEPISMVMLGCLGAGMAAARKLRRKQA